VVAHRLEVVRRHVVGDVPAQHLTLHVGRTEVEACPDPSFDDLGERLREAVEAPRRAMSGDQVGSASVAGLLSSTARWIAFQGRQKSRTTP
jgi:hypothetical protein